MLALLIIAYAVLAFIPAVVASDKGRPFLVWLIYGFLLFPIAFLHALLATPNQAVVDARKVARGAGRRCPHCAEVILPAAKVCRYCGRDVIAGPPHGATVEAAPPTPPTPPALAAVLRPPRAARMLIEGPRDGAGRAGLDSAAWTLLAAVVGIPAIVIVALIVPQKSSAPVSPAAWETSPERSLALVGCARGLEAAGKAERWISGASLDPAQGVRTTGSVDMMREVVCDFRTRDGTLGQVAVLLACDDAKNPACAPVHWVRAGEREWRAAR